MEAVSVALIAAVGTILAALVQSMRKENRDDHAIVADSLDRIETKLDKHIDDHLTGNLD